MGRDISYLKFPNPAEELKRFKEQNLQKKNTPVANTEFKKYLKYKF